MIKNNRAVMPYILMFFVGISISSISASESEPAEPDWRSLALHAVHTPTFYYDLLADGGEPEITRKIEERKRATAPTTPADTQAVRSHVLKELLDTRVALIDANPEPNDAEVRKQLNFAYDVLANNDTADLYQLLGHDTYSFVRSGPASLMKMLTEQPEETKIKLRRVAQFILSLNQGKDAAAAAVDATTNDLITNPSTVNTEDDVIAPALGKELYESIGKKDKNNLRSWATANAPDPDSLPSLHNILKEYIRMLQCSIAGAGCPDGVQSGGKNGPKTTEKSKETDDKKKDDKGTASGAAAPAGVNKKMLEDIGKANDNLQNALHYLKQAKSSISKVTTAERKVAKGQITQILNSHKPIKDAAEKMKRNPQPGYEAFIQTVADIYKEASTF